MLNRKYYQAIAEVINNNLYKDNPKDYDDLIADLAIFFKRDNPSFDKQRFYDACYKSD